MAKGEIVIDEKSCKGCGLCVHFCNRNCIVITGEKLGPTGYLVPTLSDPDRCNGCGICGWMCPDFAIEVYKIVEVSDEL